MLQCSLAYDFGEIAFRSAPHQVHLKHPILRGHITLSEEKVIHGVRINCRHAMTMLCIRLGSETVESVNGFSAARIVRSDARERRVW